MAMATFQNARRSPCRRTPAAALIQSWCKLHRYEQPEVTRRRYRPPCIKRLILRIANLDEAVPTKFLGVEELARIIASSAVRGIKAHAQRDRTQQARRSRPPTAVNARNLHRAEVREGGPPLRRSERRGFEARDHLPGSRVGFAVRRKLELCVPALLRCYHAHFAVASRSPFASKSSRCGEQKIRLAAERLKFIFQSKPLEFCFESESVCK
jgi:hypothetical protein